MSDITTKKVVTLMGLSIVAIVPATAARYDEVSGTPGDCVAEAVQNGIYRGYANLIRGEIAKAVVAKTGIPKRPSNKKTAKGADIPESDDSYIDYIKLSHKDLISAAELQAIGDAVALANPYEGWLADASTGGGKLGKEYIEQAEGVLKAWAGGESSKDIFLSKMFPILGDVTLSDEPTPEELGGVIKRYRKALSKQELI